MLRHTAITLCMLGHAQADVPRLPTVDEVKATIALFVDGTRDMLAMPFWYAGYKYIDGYPEADASCRRTWGAEGTAKDAAKTADLASCIARGAYDHIGPAQSVHGQPGAKIDWVVADLDKLPGPFRRHRTRLAALAKDHRIVISHYGTEAGESWDLYVAHRGDSGILLDAWLVGSSRH